MFSKCKITGVKRAFDKELVEDHLRYSYSQMSIVSVNEFNWGPVLCSKFTSSIQCKQLHKVTFQWSFLVKIYINAKWVAVKRSLS